MMDLDNNEKWFKEQGGGWFVTFIDGGMWERIPFLNHAEVARLIEEGLTDYKIDEEVPAKEMLRVSIKLEDKDLIFRTTGVIYAVRFPDGRQWDAVNGFRE